ncbi:methyltransferase domain-containing protein [Candidatus Roizmanbacteria bacterium]|nr:methyltransferase domain-containing protein [Candidatus Roizmanbacteria bacterium]
MHTNIVGYIAYTLALLVELIVAFSLCIYAISHVFSSLMGSPYVPTKKKEIEEMLKTAKLKKGQKFLELGSGDGRVVRTAVKMFGVVGQGIDINPTLVWIARFKARLQKLKNITFKTQNIFSTSYKDADVIYLFLMPELIAKMRPKMETEIKPTTIIISHGFKVEGWTPYQTIVHKPFPTYYYQPRSSLTKKA